MKKSIKDIIWCIVLIPFIIYIAFFIANRFNSKYPDYSVLNKSQSGLSVFYEALEELDYPVERTEEEINLISNDNIQVLVVSDLYFLNTDSFSGNEWVESGGILINLIPVENNFLLNLFVDQIEEIDRREIGEGYMITMNLHNFSNQTLVRETSYAYKLLEVFEEHNYNKIFFNESFLFSDTEQLSFWGVIPLEIKFIIYQIILSLMAFFYLKGKKFGKPIPLYEEEERLENEFLYSTASLYKKAACRDIVIENYYNDFLKEFGFSKEYWLDDWQEEELPLFKKAKKIYNFMEKNKKEINEKELIEMINILEKLKSHLKKGREINWKKIKK